jgi:hypothetical protein
MPKGSHIVVMALVALAVVIVVDKTGLTKKV